MKRSPTPTTPCTNCRRSFPVERMTLALSGRYFCREAVCLPYEPAPACATCGAHDPRYQPAQGEEVMPSVVVDRDTP
jgi:hypothetical protein